jgi:hypothetical protein
MADKNVERAVIDREWVLASLRQNCQLAMVLGEDGSPAPTFNGSVANRALELLGKELNLFSDHTDRTFKWSGDMAELNQDQRATLTATLEQIAFRDDPAGLEEWRRSQAEAQASPCRMPP